MSARGRTRRVRRLIAQFVPLAARVEPLAALLEWNARNFMIETFMQPFKL